MRNRTNTSMKSGFSLIEILISILILALGLLGLGALFPVVIREQRLGTDAVSGVIVSNSARAMLTQPQWGRALPFIAVGPPAVSSPFATADRLWQGLRDERAFDFSGGGTAPRSATNANPFSFGLGSGFTNAAMNQQDFEHGEWFVPEVNSNPNRVDAQSGLDVELGSVRIGHPAQAYYGNPAVARQAGVWLGLADRLTPLNAGVGAGEPLFVWDFAVQRVNNQIPDDSPENDPLRAVVFVRRIDTRIRLGNSGSVTRAFLDPSVNAADRRLPVGEDMMGQPTLDGTDGSAGGTLKYSTIKVAPVEFWYNAMTPGQDRRDRLYMSNTRGIWNQITPQQWNFIRQPGQKLVDNLGNVYTVTGSGKEASVGALNVNNDAGGSDYVQIDPPVPAWVTSQAAEPATTDDRRAIWQVCYTPQIPVSVTLVELIREGRR